MIHTQQPHKASTMTRVGQKSLRAHNLCLVFSHIAGAERPVSRAAIAEITGLTKATVSALVAALLEIDLIQELPPSVKPGAGRPAIPLIVAPGTVVGLGLEINVDFLGVRAVDLTGMIVEETFARMDLRQSDPPVAFAALVRQAYGLILELTNRSVRIIGACLALPGIADHPHGPLRMAPNLGWQNIDIHQLMAEAIAELGTDLDPTETASQTLDLMAGLLVDDLWVDNEANLAARTEIDKHHDQSFIYVSGEIGIGAAIVVDGRVFSGLHGWAGEIGHIVVDPQGPTCACGADGCLEMYAGKRSLMAGAGLDGDDDVDALLEALDDGSAEARATIDQAAQALGIALANSMNLIDVNRIVLGGSFARLADTLARGLSAQISSRVLSSRWVGKDLEIRASSAGDYAAATGAALAVLEEAVNDPGSPLWQQ